MNYSYTGIVPNCILGLLEAIDLLLKKTVQIDENCPRIKSVDENCPRIK